MSGSPSDPLLKAGYQQTIHEALGVDGVEEWGVELVVGLEYLGLKIEATQSE